MVFTYYSAHINVIMYDTYKHSLAYKLTYYKCDMHIPCILIALWAYYFAQMVLQLGQVPMLVY